MCVGWRFGPLSSASNSGYVEAQIMFPETHTCTVFFACDPRNLLSALRLRCCMRTRGHDLAVDGICGPSQRVITDMMAGWLPRVAVDLCALTVSAVSFAPSLSFRVAKLSRYPHTNAQSCTQLSWRFKQHILSMIILRMGVYMYHIYVLPTLSVLGMASLSCGIQVLFSSLLVLARLSGARQTKSHG